MERDPNWDYVDEALKGKLVYKLPKILQWFTGNIGFHHIHHLSPRIPNYYLEKCYNEIPIFQDIKPVTFLTSFKSMTYRLWDEKNQRLVGFLYLKELKEQCLPRHKNKKEQPHKGCSFFHFSADTNYFVFRPCFLSRRLNRRCGRRLYRWRDHRVSRRIG